jgi:hypothetical protein
VIGKRLVINGNICRTYATIKNHGQKFTLRFIAKLAARENVTLLCHCVRGRDPVPPLPPAEADRAGSGLSS